MNTEISSSQSDLPIEFNTDNLNKSADCDLGSFAKTAREWANELKPVEATKEELFSYNLALRLIEFARSTNDSAVDVPLLPSIQIDSRPSAEQIEFANSVLGLDSVSLIKKAFSKKDIKEFYIDCSGIKNNQLSGLVSDISETLPEMSLSIVAKRNRYNFAEFFIRLNSNRAMTEQRPQTPGTGSEIEIKNEKMVAETRILLQKRHKQFVEDPLTINRQALISPDESPLIVDVARQSYSRLKLNSFAINAAALAWFGQQFLIFCADAIGVNINPGNLTISGCAVAIYGFVMLLSSRDKLMHRLLVPADKLNDLTSPNIQGLLAEIRGLGYQPELLKSDRELRLSVLFKG